jgi:Trk K+ transport system NAD-binding subunit
MGGRTKERGWGWVEFSARCRAAGVRLAAGTMRRVLEEAGLRGAGAANRYTEKHIEAVAAFAAARKKAQES